MSKKKKKKEIFLNVVVLEKYRPKEMRNKLLWRRRGELGGKKKYSSKLTAMFILIFILNVFFWGLFCVCVCVPANVIDQFEIILTES